MLATDPGEVLLFWSNTGAEVRLPWIAAAPVAEKEARDAHRRDGRWVLREALGDLAAGCEVELHASDHSIPEGQGLICRRGLWGRVSFVARGEDDTEIVAAAAPKGERTSTGDDLRTLWVDHDNHGKRWKEWRAVAHECTEEVGPDAPLDGPGSTLHLLRHMERFGGNPRLWLESWSREVNLHRGDRTFHELSVLVEALLLGGCYDQLNLSALQSFEKISRRIQIIIEAHKPGQAPSWQMARYLGGEASIGDAVSPALRSYGVRRAREDYEVQNARSRVLNNKKGKDDDDGAPGGDGGDGDTPHGQGRGASMGRGRGGGR